MAEDTKSDKGVTVSEEVIEHDPTTTHIFTWADALILLLEDILNDGIRNNTLGYVGLRTIDANFKGIPFALTVSIGETEVRYIKSVTQHYGNVLTQAELNELTKGKIVTPTNIKIEN